MKTRKFGLQSVLILSLVLVLGACGRNDRTADRTDAAAPAASDREEFVREMDARLGQMETKLAETKDQIAKSSQETWNEVQREVADLRQEVAQLRNADARNWWEHTKRSLDRSVERLENTIEGRPAAEDRRTDADQPAGGDYRSERDQYVARMQSHIDQLENRLKQARDRAGRNVQQADWDEVEEELGDLRASVNDLRNTDDTNWWDITKRRVERSWDRLENSVEGAVEQAERKDRDTRGGAQAD